MKRTLFSLIAAAGLSLAGMAVHGATPRGTMLDEKSIGELQGEARVFYDLATEYNDKVNADSTVMALAEAARLAPENLSLQYLTARRARDRALAYFRGSYYAQYHLEVKPPPVAPLAAKQKAEMEALELAQVHGRITDEEFAYEKARLKIERPDYSSPPWRTSDPFLEIARECVQRLLTSESLTDEQQTRLRNESLLLERAQTLTEERDRARLESGLPFILGINQARRRALALDSDQEFDAADPATFFLQEEQNRRTQERESVLAAIIPTEQERPGFVNPYAPVPGEFIINALPTPTPPPPVPAGGIPGENFDGLGAPPPADPGQQPFDNDPANNLNLGGGK